MMTNKTNQLLQAATRANGKCLLNQDDVNQMPPEFSASHKASFGPQVLGQTALRDGSEQHDCNRHMPLSTGVQVGAGLQDAHAPLPSVHQTMQQKPHSPSRLRGRFLSLIARIRCFTLFKHPVSKEESSSYHNK